MRRVPRRFATLYGLTAVGAVLALVGDGRARPVAALAARRVSRRDRPRLLGVEIGRYILWHAAELDLALGVVGFAALIAMWLAPRSTSAGARAFSAATLSITVLLVVEVGAFASMQSFRIEERNDFYVAPFALIALLGLASRDDVVPRLAPAARRCGARRRRLAGGRAVRAVRQLVGRLRHVRVAAVVVAAGPRRSTSTQLRFVALGVGLVAAALDLRAAAVRARSALRWSRRTSCSPRRSSRTAATASARRRPAVSSPGSGCAHPNWIDRRVGRDADVSFVWHYAGETGRSGTTSSSTAACGPSTPSTGPTPRTVGCRRRRCTSCDDGRLATARVRRRGFATPSRTPTSQAHGWRATPGSASRSTASNGPIVILTRVRGLYANDTWSGRRVTYRRLRCTGGQLSVRLGTRRAPLLGRPGRDGDRGRPRRRLDRDRADRPADARRAARSGFARRLHRRLHCATLRVPARVQAGSTDTRKLGAHFFSFDYSG